MIASPHRGPPADLRQMMFFVVPGSDGVGQVVFLARQLGLSHVKVQTNIGRQGGLRGVFHSPGRRVVCRWLRRPPNRGDQRSHHAGEPRSERCRTSGLPIAGEAQCVRRLIRRPKEQVLSV